MLYRNKVLKETQPDGSILMTVLPGVEPEPCAVCGRESIVNSCEGDGRLHHHGRVHSPGNGLEARCRLHGSATFQAMQWATFRANRKED